MKEIIFSIVIMIASIVIFIASLQLPESAWEPLGPGFFPKVIALGVFFLGLILIIQTLVVKKVNAKKLTKFNKNKLVSIIKKYKMVIFSFIIFFFYIFLLEYIGFIVMSFVFLFAFQWLMDYQNLEILKTLLISIIVPVIIYYVFANFLYIYLPMGILKVFV